jgi:membrane protease YdiL (CAAX protease family)
MRARQLSPASFWAPLAVYGALGIVSIAAALARGKSPVFVGEAEAWLTMPPALGHALSLLLGGAIAVATVGATRQFVRRWDWARALHADLRPTVRGASGGAILVLGIASAASEELFFRGLLTTALGLVVSSFAFGLLHQVRGRARWVWAAWATVMGFLFGALLLSTGSLLGPIVAHAAINVANLRFLRDTDIEPPKPRRLGGLLGRA